MEAQNTAVSCYFKPLNLRKVYSIKDNRNWARENTTGKALAWPVPIQSPVLHMVPWQGRE